MSTNLQSFNRSRIGAFTQSELGARNAAGKRILIWNKDGMLLSDPRHAIEASDLEGMDVEIDGAIANGGAPEWTHNLGDYTMIHFANPDSRSYTRPEWYDTLLAEKWRGRLLWRVNTANASAKVDANALAETTSIPSPVRLSERLSTIRTTQNAVSFSHPLTKGVDPFPRGGTHGRVSGGFRLAGIPRDQLLPTAASNWKPWAEDVPYVSESSNGRFSIVLLHGIWGFQTETENVDGTRDITNAARFFRNLYEVDI